MRKYFYVLLSLAFVFAATGCSSSKERDDWQQYRAKKAQEEMSSDVNKQDSGTVKE
jgi:hypothetical protein